MLPANQSAGATTSSQSHNTNIQHRYGHDGQRERVAHMPTATTTAEDSRSKLLQNHPHDFTMSEKNFATSCREIQAHLLERLLLSTDPRFFGSQRLAASTRPAGIHDGSILCAEHDR